MFGFGYSAPAAGLAPSFASPSPYSHSSLSLTPSTTPPRRSFVDTDMSSLPPHPPSTHPRLSILHRRSRAEAEAESSDSDSSRSPHPLHDVDSDDDLPPPHPLHSKRVKLNTLLPLSFDSASPSPPLASYPPPHHTLTPPSAWAPSKPSRSRSLGDSAHSPHSVDSSPPTLSLPSSPPSLPTHPPSIILPPPASRPRSILPFSPRSHSQFLVPPTVNHSPRASLPFNLDGATSPLESLFTRLTMQEPTPHPPPSFDRRNVSTPRGYKSKKGEHRRSLSISISPASPSRGSLDATPPSLREGEGGSPQPPSWMVRVDSVGEMADAMARDGGAAAPTPTVLTGQSMLHFFSQLRLHENDWTTLALAWKWNCSKGGAIYRHEFVAGMKAMGCSTLEQLQEKVTQLRSQLEADPTLFSTFFRFVFQFVRTTQESNRKTIALDTARRLLHSLLASHYPHHIEPFTRYLEGLGEGRPGMRMTYDQWMSVLDWCEQMDAECLRYEEEGSWPVLLDDFVDWLRTHEPQRMAAYEDRERRRATSAPRPMVERMTRMHMEMKEEEGRPSPVSTHRASSLSVRVPRPLSIEAQSLDSDDHRGGWSRTTDGLSRSLPSLPSLEARVVSSPVPMKRGEREWQGEYEGPLTLPSLAQVRGEEGGAVFSRDSWSRFGPPDNASMELDDNAMGVT